VANLQPVTVASAAVVNGGKLANFSGLYYLAPDKEQQEQRYRFVPDKDVHKQWHSFVPDKGAQEQRHRFALDKERQ
jgi:hypothetical protein